MYNDILDLKDDIKRALIHGVAGILGTIIIATGVASDMAEREVPVRTISITTNDEPVVETSQEDLQPLTSVTVRNVEPVPEEVIEVEVPVVEPAVTSTPEPIYNGTNIGQFKISAYCHCTTCCGKSDGITATGTRVTANRTIAVDPNVIPLGSSVVIDGNTYVAEDTGGAIKGNRIDMYFATHQDALNFGIQYKNVSIIN